jgi:acyl-CoA thioester hydrolase
LKPVRVQIPYRVPYADTDRMGVVYYGNYLTYFERVRNELLRELDFTYQRLEERGYGLPVAEAHVKYRAAAEYDDLLAIHGWVGWVKSVRLCVNCAVYRGEDLLAEGFTVHAFVDLESLRPARMPSDIAALFQGAAEGSDP